MNEKEQKITVSDRILAATFLKLLPARVTPNHLTIFRFIMVPVVAFAVFLELYPLSVILFIVAAFTDALDGALARTRNQITDWGKMYDPMADKLLIGLVAILLIPRFMSFGIAFMIILIEMMLIGSAYYLKHRRGKEIRANAWGKTKMILQSTGVAALLLFAISGIPFFYPIALYALYGAIVFGAVSILTYSI
ncbi:MAG: CDP-alcohol phosphatidyltransferase family protein [Patescibacteria group bacterium]